ncbi:HIRAN domain-containing protein [Bifidobacterium minimum]|uniref:HIRAN domain-containing protein n=1 Tax=Bifidobacterium minimum TaxID=1693 RepID=UPI0012699A19|nr:HIRAN domain-containing protein [Bifidobacterium minimum]
MGFLKSLIGQLHADSTQDNASIRRSAGSSSNSANNVLSSQVGLVSLSGTTTICKEEIARLAEQHQLAENGYLEIEGKMQREPANTYDPSTIAVFAEGYKVGYLPGYVAHILQLPTESSQTLRIQLFTAVLQQNLRCEAWAWIGNGDPQWARSKEHRPPMSSKEMRHARFEATESMLRS